MRPFLLLPLLFILSACTQPSLADDYIPSSPGSYAYGADVSWLTEEENDGVLFYDSLSRPADGLRVLRDAGMNSVRLRVWVNHSTEWCNLPDVLVKARRAKALHLRLMIDFHYSDFFADPSTQTTPLAWQSYNITQLDSALAAHTREVLSALQSEGISPEWIQIGNETRCGMLWPLGQLWNQSGDLPNGWKNYASLTATGYDVCKSIFPDALVIVHIDNAYQDNRWFFRKLRQNEGKFDMIGLSHYPMMREWSSKDWDEMNLLCAANIRSLHQEFQCPIMLTEIGTLSSQPTQAATVIADLRSRVDTLSYMKGIFYWEPQIYNNWRPKEYVSLGWNAYQMGAFTSSGQPNAALHALWKH